MTLKFFSQSVLTHFATNRIAPLVLLRVPVFGYQLPFLKIRFCLTELESTTSLLEEIVVLVYG